MTVSDFRSADIAAGGQGAPLVPVYDYVLLRSSKKSRIALNIGGIANLTVMPRKAKLGEVIAFDTGPGNCMIDTAVRLRAADESASTLSATTDSDRGGAPSRLASGGSFDGDRARAFDSDGALARLKDGVAFDRDGALARAGEADDQCIEEVLAHPYFARKPPKTTGWEDFGADYTRGLVDDMAGRGRSTRDILRTLTEITATTIADAIEDFIRPEMEVDEVIVTGGGTHNPMLMDLLKKRLPEIAVDIGEAHGIDSDSKEACAFAYLAYLRLEGIAANIVSQASGCEPALLGSVSEPA
jgi:anhydro-N-acetylmuramic acid kinase